jgi:hypothetical protein
MVRIALTCFFVLGWLISEAQDLKLEHIRTYSGHSHGVKKVVFSPNGTHFVSGGTRGELFIWDLDGTDAVKKLEGHFGSVLDVRYSSDGKYLISAGEDGQIKVWDSATGLCLQKIMALPTSVDPNNKLTFALVAVESGMIYFGGTNRQLSKVKLNSDERPKLVYADAKDPVQCGILNPNGKEIVIAAGQFLIAIDLASGKVLREYNTGTCGVNSLEFSADGTKLLTWCSNSRVDIRDPKTFFLKTSFRSGDSGRKFSNLAITDDQRFVVSVDFASRFNIWDLEMQKRVLDQGAEQGTIMAFDLDKGSQYLLSGSVDKSIKLWQIVPNVLEDVKKKSKKQIEEVEVEPEVEIVQHAEPVEDVEQPLDPVKGPAPTNLVLKQPDTIPTYTPSTKNERSIVSELPDRKENRRVLPIRREHRLTLTGTMLTFEIWDAQVIDGDIVSIYVGDECIVKEYSITAEKKSVQFDASAYKRVYVYLHAHNLGTLPPNTVTLTVSDGIQTHEVELRSDLSGSSAMELTFLDSE